MNKTLKIRTDHWTLKVLILNYGLVLILMMVTWGLPKDGSYGERIFIFKHTILK